MYFGEIIYQILIGPLQLFFEMAYTLAYEIIGNPGLSIIVLSLAMNFLVLPLYKRADAMQEEERLMEQKLSAGVSHIKKTFNGDERMMMLSTYYRLNDYRPTDVFKGALSLFLEIPFFIAAYQFLSHLDLIKGVAFGPLKDLGAPDGLLVIGALTINVMPIIMTSVNLISCVLFTKDHPLKTKIQLYSLAVFFLIFLYNSPSGLVFYWTLNNVFSLVKTVFYKLKNPRKALNTILAIGGVAVMAAGVLSVGKITLAYILVILMVGAVMLMPALISALASRISFGSISFTKEPHPKWFFAAMIFLAVMVGGFIPSMVIRSSPQEFIDSITNLNPVMFIASALCYSAGFFLVWMGVFYWIADKRVKPFFEMGAVVYCCLAVFNYFGFNSTSGLLSNTLISSNGLLFLTSTLLINTGLTVVVLAVAGFAYIKLSSYLVKIAGIAAVALMALTVVNAVEINNNVKPFLIDSNHEDEIPVFQLSTDGQNVVVIMVDRALSEFFPYIVDEKPELKESFSGFTFYPNTLSFGLITKIASPALFGGYEYTPDAINSKDEQTLIEKQNEADKMMPVLFSENGFDTVVCDPVYPNYQWKTDLSIFNEYPDISAYKMIGNLKGDYEVGIIKKDKRNFYCFGLMKTMPLFFQKIVYNDGAYLNASRDKVVEGQIWKDDFSASGIDADYYTSYTALDNLDNITTVCEDDSNHFLMFRNDITHGPTMLQMPGYEMKWEVDNTEYFDGQLPTEFTLSDNSASYNNNGFYSYLFYQVNMSAMTKLAEWLDYLKECGVYDNTRIIIVADHGHGLGNNPELQMDYEDSSDQYAERVYDMTAYNPLLLVKDFDESEFKVSEKFMTNADVPTLAAEGVIDNPVNPFTGNSINSNRKEQDVLYVFGTSETNIEDGKNNTYEPGDWFSVYDEVHDINNWSVVKQNAVLPY